MFIYKNLIYRNGMAPKIYGLEKIHEEGFHLRPIVASFGSATHKLAKILTSKLSCVYSDYQVALKTLSN